MINLLRVLILLTVFLTPLLGPGSLGYEQTKVIFFFIMTSVSGLVWLYLIYRKQIKFRLDLISRIAGIFIIWLLIASLLGINPTVSLAGSQPYLQGWITYLYLYIFFLVVKDAKIPLLHLAAALSLSAFLVSEVAIKEWILVNLAGINIPTYAGRVVSTFGQPNLYSGYLLLTLPFGWTLLQKKGRTLLLLPILAIILSESRTAIFGLVTIAFLVAFYKLKKLTSPYNFIGIFLLTASLVIGAIVFYQGNIQKEFIISSDGEWLIHNSPEKRVFIWPVFLNLIAQRPMLGYGLESIPEVFTNYFKKIDFSTLNNPVYHSLKNVSIDRTHNYLLDLSTFSGILGALIWLIIIFLILKRTRSNILKAGLIIYIIWVQFQPQGIVQLLYFWLLAAGFGSIDKRISFKP